MLSYAEMAEWEQGHDVNIAADEGKSLIIVDENGSQKVGLGKAIQDITVAVDAKFFCKHRPDRFPSASVLS